VGGTVGDTVRHGEGDTVRARERHSESDGAGDTQLALGYRHMHGLGVPKSCAAAVLYYIPPAERVIERARGPTPFPGVERIRLSVDHDSSYNPGREQEMVQYFQVRRCPEDPLPSPGWSASASAWTTTAPTTRAASRRWCSTSR
jgi:hypothetical protein